MLVLLVHRFYGNSSLRRRGVWLDNLQLYCCESLRLSVMLFREIFSVHAFNYNTSGLNSNVNTSVLRNVTRERTDHVVLSLCFFSRLYLCQQQKKQICGQKTLQQHETYSCTRARVNGWFRRCSSDSLALIYSLSLCKTAESRESQNKPNQYMCKGHRL